MKESKICRDDQRRHALRDKHRNGLDYVEVGPTQLTLKVFFIGDAPAELGRENFRIDGGVRITDIEVTKATRVERGDDELDDHWLLRLNRFGDFSDYTLRIVKPDEKGRPGESPLDEFDPRYSALTFNFKTDCPSDFDCLPSHSCSPQLPAGPEVNYLAKDYASFRQLILDRLAVLMPDWTERHAADLGITLVELLAYTGDYLSYYQDAVATESYLGTARRRISVRRHARLVDYILHEGCNARAWVFVETDADVEIDASDTFFTTQFETDVGRSRRVLTTDDLRDISQTSYEVFEPVVKKGKIKLYQAHNELLFHTWGNRECCLPAGSTRAALLYEWKPEPQIEAEKENVQARQQSQAPVHNIPDGDSRKPINLKPGDVLIIEEVKGPRTGNPADADTTHRHPLRLTIVAPGVDELLGKQIVEVEWSDADALPFAVCISSTGPASECCEEITDVSVAHGNVVLVDHGRTGEPEDFNVPMEEQLDAGCESVDQPRDLKQNRLPFTHVSRRRPLTHSVTFPRPDAIARRQAEILDRLEDDIRSRVRSLLQKSKAGHSLTGDELNELRTIYGRKSVVNVDLLDSAKDVWKQMDASGHAAALAKLIENDQWLNKKLRRLDVLRDRAEDGYVLDEDAVREIGEMFGAHYANQLNASSASLFGPARDGLTQCPREALPYISLSEPGDTYRLTWTPRRDLLDSRAGDRHFVAEIDDQGAARLRFGNGESGRSPDPGTKLTADYRTGNGTSGNVGAETIRTIAFRKTQAGGLQHLRPRNPLPAVGGTDPELVAEAKLFAPGAFRKDMRRAVTDADYASLAERNQNLQAAAASLEWTGSWYEAAVAVDPLHRAGQGDQLLKDIERHLYDYRRMGHDVRVNRARYVPVEIEIKVCVRPQYLRGHVKERLLNAFSDRTLGDGRRGFFHPDNLTFGSGIYASRLVALAQDDPGVESAIVTKLHRLYAAPAGEIENGVLPLGPFEIPQLATDPNFPEYGKLTVVLQGGR